MHKTRPPLRTPGGGTWLGPAHAARELGGFVINYAPSWEVVIGWGSSTGHLYLICMVGISAFLVALRAPSRGLRMVSSPVVPLNAEPSTTPISSDEAFWDAVQAG